LGAFKAYPSNKKSGKFSVAPMAGDSVYIEYLAPAHMSRYPIIHVSRVVYGYKSLAFLEQQPYRRPDDQFIIQKRHSGRCNVDILCDNAGMDWSNEARAVAVLLTNENQVYCTGVLLNNVEYNGRQLLLTVSWRKWCEWQLSSFVF
jgi:hypothetical protein